MNTMVEAARLHLSVAAMTGSAGCQVIIKKSGNLFFLVIFFG